MSPVLKLRSPAVRAGFLGFISGVLSCLLVESRIIYIAREQKTFDHVVWPGVMFALVVLLPISRWAGDAWRRTVVVVVTSFAAYPMAWRLAVSSTVGPASSWGLMIGAFALAGLLGSLILASVVLFGRTGRVRAALEAGTLGAGVGGLMGANLAAAMMFAHWPVPARDGLGLFVVLWQTFVGASLGRGVQVRPERAMEPSGADHGTGSYKVGGVP